MTAALFYYWSLNNSQNDAFYLTEDLVSRSSCTVWLCNCNWLRTTLGSVSILQQLLHHQLPVWYSFFFSPTESICVITRRFWANTCKAEIKSHLWVCPYFQVWELLLNFGSFHTVFFNFLLLPLFPWRKEHWGYAQSNTAQGLKYYRRWGLIRKHTKYFFQRKLWNTNELGGIPQQHWINPTSSPSSVRPSFYPKLHK